jgi:hypothetical protein
MHLSTLVEIAADLRRKAGLLRPPYSTRAIIEASFPSALVTGGVLPDGVDEIVSQRPDGPIIIYARHLPGPGQRYVIGHALSHLIFDDERVCARAGHAGDPTAEARADLFSSELFVPASELRGLVRHWPSRDLEDHEIYLDHLDQLASTFAMPASVIDEQVRRLVPVDVLVKRCG